MASTKVNYKIYQGSTFNEVIRWESSTKVYKPITGINKAAPMLVTAAGHGLLAGWRASISNVVGMTEANALENIVATSVTSDTATFNDINAVGFKDYVSGGILSYYAPVDLTGMTARMQLREKLTSTATLLELTTENAMLMLNNSTKTITINIPAATTQLLTFKTAVYSLEMVSGSVVIPLIHGTITLDSEITR